MRRIDIAVTLLLIAASCASFGKGKVVETVLKEGSIFCKSEKSFKKFVKTSQSFMADPSKRTALEKVFDKKRCVWSSKEPYKAAVIESYMQEFNGKRLHIAKAMAYINGKATIIWTNPASIQ